MLGKLYCLVDPRTGQPFYVGTTYRKLRERLAQHIAVARNLLPHQDGIIERRGRFINDMVAHGIKPEIKLLFVSHIDNINRIEGETYRLFCDLGYNLLQSDCRFFTNNKPTR